MPRYFDSDLPRVGADKLKPMAKIWGGDSKMRKDECIACTAAGLKDPKKVKAVVAGLQPWERNALAAYQAHGWNYSIQRPQSGHSGLRFASPAHPWLS